MLETRVSPKGQVTIPAEVRARLGLKPRDRVRFEVQDGKVTITKAKSGIEAGYGSIKPRQKPEDFRKLREEFERGVAEEVMAETSDS
jgi:AbrB family looped-hinge helix DNA binding protein